jgi:hypothetical protein
LILLLPSLAAIAYSPWPQFEHFYGLPFLIAPALLLALAATALEERGGAPKRLAHLSCFGIILLTGMQALYLSRESTARQEINYHVATALAALGPSDSAFVALKSTYSESWRGPGPALMRYGGVLAGRTDMPTVVNVACEDIPRLLRTSQTSARRALVSYTSICGELAKPSRSIRRSFTFIDLGSPPIRSATMGADVMILGGESNVQRSRREAPRYTTEATHQAFGGSQVSVRTRSVAAPFRHAVSSTPPASEIDAGPPRSTIRSTGR